jgi:Heterokaryon incompatibility protein (HET)
MDLYRSLPLLTEPPSIRLIEFELGGDQNSKIRLKMDAYKIHFQPDYDAISYHWGEYRNLVDIYINGHDYPVTENLHNALQQFRSNQRSSNTVKKKLWIDAICIHQADKAEKTFQLTLMKDIFSGASNVLVWLGKSDDLTELVFDTLERFAPADGTQDGSTIYWETNILDREDERRTAIQKFVTRSYFDRVWIIQEVTVAKKAMVFCGLFSITFEKLYSACQKMTGSGFFPFSTSGIGKLTYLGDWRKAFQEIDTRQREDAFDMNVFVDFRNKQATDLRDKVYALRGLANNIIRKGIVVDYHHSIKRVYTDFAKHLLMAQPGLRVLSAVVLRHRWTSLLRLPSWVPDWSQPQLGGGILQKYYRFMPSAFFKAGGTGQPRRVSEMEDPDTVCLEGIVLDIVKRIIPIKSFLIDRENHLSEASVRQMAAETALQEIYPFTGEVLWKVFFRTLTADRSVLSTRIHEIYRAQYLSGFHDLIPHSPGVDRLDGLPAAAWAEIAKTLSTIIEDKIMFTTPKGYLGLCQEGSQVGDVLCIFSGGETPFLLRPASPLSDRRFQLLSECYVHGVMDGELMNSDESRHLDRLLIQ